MLAALFHLLEHLDGILKMPLKVFAHGVQDFDEQGIAQRVKNLIALLARDHQMAVPQNGQVLRKIGRLHFHLLQNCPDAKARPVRKVSMM